MGTTPYQSSLDPLRVVVVDPSLRTHELFREALADEGCELAFSPDGFQALACLDEVVPDLVFLASECPRLDGYQVSHIIRQNSRMKTVPIVLMSHDPDLFARAHGRLVGANAHLAVPLSSHTILETFRQFSD